LFKNRFLGEGFILACIVLIIIALMLYFGLRPKGYQPANNLQWVDGGPGIAFDRFAVAYTDEGDFSFLQQSSFSVVFAARPELSGRAGFRFIMAAHDGDDGRQLLIGQWRSWLIAMNGDDYDNSRKVKRISVEIAHSDGPVFVVLASGEGGTSVYVNGQLQRTDPSLRLRWPNADGAARLVVGNSVYGRHPWQGELLGLAVFGYALDEDGAGALFREWKETGKFAFSDADGLKMLFPFDEGAGEIAHDRSGSGLHLAMPSRMRILKKEMLVPPWRNATNQSGLVLDAAVNFFGFWPLGFFLSAMLARTRRFQKCYWQVTVLFCLAFSLSLETVQVWVPSRSSDMLDLILNTLGGGTGAMVYAVLHSRCLARHKEGG